VSSIEPCEESETQLYIANSLEVRSDEICVESVLSPDDVVQSSKTSRVDAIRRNSSLHTVFSNQKDSGTVANSIQLRSRRHSSNQKSHCATSAGDAASFQHKTRCTSYHSDAEADVSDIRPCSLHPDAVDHNSASLPLKQNGVLKLSSQV